jgi:hypothetical protein
MSTILVVLAVLFVLAAGMIARSRRQTGRRASKRRLREIDDLRGRDA